MKGVTKGNIKKYALNEFLTEYKELNTDNKYRPVAVGRYGIRKRESIYSKELAKDYSKNKLIHKDTLTVGMGSKQIDIGILIEDETFAVSPAYHTYEIQGIRCKYLEYCLQSKNIEMFSLYAKRGSRQGKSIDLKRWLTYKIPVYSEKDQIVIEENLNKINYVIELRRKQIDLLDELVKARFVEMFGDPVVNDKKWEIRYFSDLGELKRGKSKHRPRNDPILLGGKYPLIQTGDVTNSNTYIKSYTSTYSEEGLKQSKMWKKGTLCITIAANIAESAILTFDACFPDSVVGFTPNGEVISLFIHYWLSFLQPILEENAPAVAQKNLNVAALEKVGVIVPPLELQNQFASFVQEIDKSRSRIQKSLEASQELFDSLMQEYFG